MALEKTDYFGTFLNVVADAGRVAARTLMTANTDPLDALVLALFARQGQASISDLLEAPFASISAVAAAADQLQGLGLAQKEGAVIRLTGHGQEAARKLRATSGQEPAGGSAAG